MNSSAGGVGGNNRSAFTVSQWQELEHQALIFKYMMAGMPVPPDLVLPIQKSFDSISHRFFHPSMGYCSFYGKKVDPEPGRCRRTDGKKWRCSKDAYLDSKYCERHMHRGRNRSRKPVESQTITHSSSSVTVSGTGSATGSFQTLPLNSFGNTQGASSVTSQSSYHQIESIPFGIPNKDYRYLQGLEPDLDEHSFFSDTSGSNKILNIDSALNSPWPVMRSGVASFPTLTSGYGSILQNDSQHHSLFNDDFPLGEPLKLEGQSLRPFFDECPKGRDSWCALEDERSKQTSFSTTQLSISIPVASSELSSTSCQSPKGSQECSGCLINDKFQF